MYSKKYIDIITLVLVLLIFILINVFQFVNKSNIEKVLNQNQIQSMQEELPKENNFVEEAVVEEIAYKTENISNKNDYPSDWYIIIPSIDLIAPIRHGTDEDTLNQFVGHFEESPLLNGNICLAAHNRGYDVNYFEKVKNLLLNDIIIYQYGNIQQKYSVSNVTIIKDTDWSYIDNSNEDKITLITCVQDEPEYRLCIQAEKID